MHVMQSWSLGYMEGHSSHSPWLNHGCKIECPHTQNTQKTHQSFLILLSSPRTQGIAFVPNLPFLGSTL